MISDAFRDWGLLLTAVISMITGAVATLMAQAFVFGRRSGETIAQFDALWKAVKALESDAARTDARRDRAEDAMTERIKESRQEPSERIMRLEDRSSRIEEILAQIEEKSVRANDRFTSSLEQLGRIELGLSEIAARQKEIR